MSLSHREWYHSHIHCTFRNLTRLGPALATFEVARHGASRTGRGDSHPIQVLLSFSACTPPPCHQRTSARELQLCLRAAAPSLARTRARGEKSAASGTRPPRPLTKAGSLSPRQATRSDRGHMWLFDYLWSMLNALGALRHCTDSHGAVLRCCCCCSRSRCCCACASQVWPTRTPRFSSLAWTMPARRRCCTCSRTSASRSTTRRSTRVRALPDSCSRHCRGRRLRLRLSTRGPIRAPTVVRATLADVRSFGGALDREDQVPHL